MHKERNILDLKKILYLICLFFLFSCTYFTDKNPLENNLINKNQEITVDTFLGIDETTSLNNSGTYDKETNTGTILPEMIKDDTPGKDSLLEIKNEVELDENISKDDINETETKNIDEDILNSIDENDDIENIELKIDEIITEDSLKEIEMLEETTEEDIEELINILFDTSN